MKRQPVLIIRQVLLLTNLEEIIPPMNVSCPNGEGAYEVGSRLQHKTISLHRVKTSVSIALALRFFFFFWLLFIQLLQLFICSSLAWGGGGCQVKQCNVDLHSRRHPARWQTKKAQQKQDFVGNQSIQK